MAFDGFTINALVHELNEKIIMGRIEKIYQPEKDELYLNIRSNKKNYTLLLAANSNNPRAYLTTKQKENPLTPPTFCMLLRKSLIRGKIVSIRQPNMDRIIEIDILTANELGDLVPKMLIIEIMGRHSNIILIEKESRIIIDSIKRIGSNISRYRQVLPGYPYIYPPNRNKHNPLMVRPNIMQDLLAEHSKNLTIEKFFIKNFNGISPLIAREICFLSGTHSEQQVGSIKEKQKKYLMDAFLKLLELIQEKKFYPNIIYNHNKTKVLDFSVIPIKQYNDMPKKHFDTISQLLETYYYERDKLERLKQKNSDLMQLLKNKIERSYKKLNLQYDEYKKAENAEMYRLYGELIIGNIYRLKKGLDYIELENFYSGPAEIIRIPLNKHLTPSENAQKYFKIYNKSRNALQQLSKQIELTQEEIYYLESQIQSLKNCTEIEEIDEIRDELVREGYLSHSSKQTSKTTLPSSPMHFKSRDNLDIYVGKNNKQNDYLALKFAFDKDLWFHTKNIPGSHVILKSLSQNQEISRDSIEDAALLSAFYSKARNSNKVPVDFTYSKFVKKPKGAKPGMVNYENQKTIYVTPTEEKISKLKRVK